MPAPSRLGLASPVGLSQGAFGVVQGASGKEVGNGRDFAAAASRRRSRFRSGRHRRAAAARAGAARARGPRRLHDADPRERGPAMSARAWLVAIRRFLGRTVIAAWPRDLARGAGGRPAQRLQPAAGRLSERRHLAQAQSRPGSVRVAHQCASGGADSERDRAVERRRNVDDAPRDRTAAFDRLHGGELGSVIGKYSDGLNPVIFDTDGSITDALFGAGAKNSILGLRRVGVFGGQLRGGRGRTQRLPRPSPTPRGRSSSRTKSATSSVSIIRSSTARRGSRRTTMC